MNSTDEGITISFNPVLPNTYCSIRDDRDPDSKITADSELHFEKHSSSKNSTDEGITISSNPISLNVCLAIREKFGSDSNVTDRSDTH
jgi:hypothetical protein